jgi:hypothetical protein
VFLEAFRVGKTEVLQCTTARNSSRGCGLSVPERLIMSNWKELIENQTRTEKFRPVEEIWREHGWIPPSTECPDTMAKHKAFREWSIRGIVDQPYQER